MITVLLDGSTLSDVSRQRGIGTYLTRLVEGLAREPDIAVKLVGEHDVPLPPGVQLVPLHLRAPLRFKRLEHEFLLPGRLDRVDADVFHSPAQHPPRRSPMPWVQTLHDLIPLTRPHPLLEADRRRWHRIGPRLRSASAVVAVSRFSADEAIRLFGLDPARVHVIAHGVDTAIFHPAKSDPADPPYLLHVAAWGPHKGYGEALLVIAALAEHDLPHRLVLAGPHDEWMLSQIRAAVEASPRPDRVDVAGYVEDLASLYRGATALLMTSRAEGFGFPALEAMACGTPVVAFANSSIPEVVGGGGTLVADGDVEGMILAVRRLVESSAPRAEQSEQAVRQAARFRWDHAIRAYADLFRSVAR